MKKIVYFVLLSLCLSALPQHENSYIIVYEKRKITTFSDEEVAALPPNLARQVVREINNTYTIHQLTINKHKSQYLFERLISPEGSHVTSSPLNVFKDYDTHKLVMISPGMKKNTMIVDTMKSIAYWKLIKNEEKYVCGYKCKKAIAENGKVTAWYAPEIPLPDGPSYYCGLPGLILEVQRRTANKTTVLRATAVNQAPQAVDIQIPDRPKHITLKEYKRSLGF